MSGGTPPDIGSLSLGAAGGGAAGGNGDSNALVENDPNGRAPPNSVMFGNKEDGALRYSQFKLRMTKVFQLNAETGCIFVALHHSIAVKHFYDELYLSYLLYFKANPQCFNTTHALHSALFDSDSQYSFFKHFIVKPNLTYSGLFGFPVELGVKEAAARNWLKCF